MPSPRSTRRFTALLASMALGGVALVAMPGAYAAAPVPGSLTTTQLDGGSTKFSWDAVAGVASYRVQVSKDETFAPDSIVTEVPATSPSGPTFALAWVPQGVLGTDVDRDLYWRVFPTNTSAYSEVESINVPALAAPVTIAPGSTDLPTTVTYPTPVVFSWQPVPGAISYTVDYSSDSSFPASTATITAEAISSSYTPPAPLARQSGSSAITWSWRVRANFLGTKDGKTGSAVTGPTSPVRQFQVLWPASVSRPTLVSPQDGTAGRVYSDLEFRWEPVAGASKYKIELSKARSTDGQTVVNPEITAEVTSTVYVPEATLVDGTYFWQVTPYDTAAPPATAGTPSLVYQFKKSWDYAGVASTTTPLDAVYPQPLVLGVIPS